MKLFELFRNKNIFPSKAKELTATFSYILKDKNISFDDFSGWLDLLEKSLPDDARNKTGLFIYKLTENSFNIHFKKIEEKRSNGEMVTNRENYFKKREEIAEKITDKIFKCDETRKLWNSFTKSGFDVVDSLLNFGIENKIISRSDIPVRDYL